MFSRELSEVTWLRRHSRDSSTLPQSRCSLGIGRNDRGKATFTPKGRSSTKIAEGCSSSSQARAPALHDFKGASTPTREKRAHWGPRAVPREHRQTGVAMLEKWVLKRRFQNRFVPEGGVVKMYYFASFLREIFVDGGSAFRLEFVVLVPVNLRATVGSTFIAGFGSYIVGSNMVGHRERRRRGDPERPATLWTVTYRMGPSFRGL